MLLCELPDHVAPGGVKSWNKCPFLVLNEWLKHPPERGGDSVPEPSSAGGDPHFWPRFEPSVLPDTNPKQLFSGEGTLPGWKHLVAGGLQHLGSVAVQSPHLPSASPISSSASFIHSQLQSRACHPLWQQIIEGEAHVQYLMFQVVLWGQAPEGQVLQHCSFFMDESYDSWKKT